MPLNLTQKILHSHLVSGDVVVGADVIVGVDQVLIEDATGTMAGDAVRGARRRRRRRSAGGALRRPQRAADRRPQHAGPPLPAVVLRTATASATPRPGNGISHYVHLERFARPGELLVGADSHTTTAGALGMFAIGAGGLEVAVAMAGYGVRAALPRVVGVELTGRLRRLGRGQGRHPGAAAPPRRARRRRARSSSSSATASPDLSTTGRATICNMIVETGATTARVPQRRADAAAGSQRRAGRPTSARWPPTPAAAYDDDGADRPVRGWSRWSRSRTRPGNVVPVARGRRHRGRAGLRRLVGQQLLRGPRDGRRRAPRARGAPGRRADRHARVPADPRHDRAAPASTAPARRRRADAGADLRAVHRHRPGADQRAGRRCARSTATSPAAAAPPRTRSTCARPSTAAAERADRRHHRPADRCDRPPLRPRRAARRLADRRPASSPRRCPRPSAERSRSSAAPNLVPPPQPEPLRDDLDARVLIVVGDDISTGDMAPDGAIGMSRVVGHRRVRAGSCSAASTRTSTTARWQCGRRPHRRRPQLRPGLARASTPRWHRCTSACRAVVARSFARIHRRNLIAVGILPLVFADDAAWSRSPGRPALADPGASPRRWRRPWTRSQPTWKAPERYASPSTSRPASGRSCWPAGCWQPSATGSGAQSHRPRPAPTRAS